MGLVSNKRERERERERESVYTFCPIPHIGTQNPLSGFSFAPNCYISGKYSCSLTFFLHLLFLVVFCVWRPNKDNPRLFNSRFPAKQIRLFGVWVWCRKQQSHYIINGSQFENSLFVFCSLFPLTFLSLHLSKRKKNPKISFNYRSKLKSHSVFFRTEIEESRIQVTFFAWYIERSNSHWPLVNKYSFGLIYLLICRVFSFFFWKITTNKAERQKRYEKKF